MATARAEARRKAILARGNDRLSKLTTSARGEDHPVYTHDDPPLPTVGTNLSTFIGEDTQMPAPPAASSAPADPSAWSEEQQRQFMQALMGGAGAGSTPGGTPLPGMPSLPSTPGGGFNFDPAAAGANGGDPLSALMAQFQQPGEQAAPMTPPKPPTLLQKLMPLLHLLSVWAMLAFFVLAKEPLVWRSAREWGIGWDVDVDGVWWGMWRRWGELSRSGGIRSGSKGGELNYAVQAVPFFWGFLTLQLGIHSMRIFAGIDKVQPPMLLSLALPYLPAPLPTLITLLLKYVNMAGFFLDDVAALIVGLGFLVWAGGWVKGVDHAARQMIHVVN